MQWFNRGLLQLFITTFFFIVSETRSSKTKDDNLRHLTPEQKQLVFSLTKKAYELTKKKQNATELWEQILEIHPTSVDAHLQLGSTLTRSKDWNTRNKGLNYFENLLNRKLIPFESDQAFVIAQIIARYRIQSNEYFRPQHFLKIAQMGRNEPDVFTDVMLATLINPFPESIEVADTSMQLYHERMDDLIDRAAKMPDERLYLNTKWLSMIPGLVEDTYVHCFKGLFFHSFYYREDIRDSASKSFQVASKIWPELLYTSPNLKQLKDKSNHLPKNNSNTKHCVDRKIKLGIASGHFGKGSPVAHDFQGVLKNLDREIFDITYILFFERKEPPHDVMLDTRDTFLLVKKEMNDSKGTNKWMEKPRKDIEALDLDVLLYLDLTMSTFAHRMGMSRLAPVQAVSHGHPMTSGFPNSIMNYYISWSAAELPLEESQQHYTETLKLLPAGSLHQHYDYRASGGISQIDGQSYMKIVAKGRSAFPTIKSSNVTWYLCMQKPFKLHPEFDMLVTGIQREDPNAIIILHEEHEQHGKEIFEKRLKSAGCDMDRISFLPFQSHHKLLALYELSDIVLDSYPAGGCTTTREVLELGKIVVTLPAKYLGSRWSLAYYNILGDKILNDLVVAENTDDYIKKASVLGKNAMLRKETEDRIKKNRHKLFHSQQSITEWTKILLDIAPVETSSVFEGTCDEMRYEL